LTAVSSNENPSRVKVTVEDSGIGMSQDNVKKLFTSYTHIEFEGRQKMNPTGVSLGLNIASNLVELLAPLGRTTIDVKSELGQGSASCFFLENKELTEEKQNDSLEVAEELPGAKLTTFSPKLQKTNTSTSLTRLVSRNMDSERASEESPKKCSCPKILIVDDNPFNTMAFETILESLEIECESVCSGSSAINS